MKIFMKLSLALLLGTTQAYARNMSIQMSSSIPGTDKSTGIGGSKRFNMLNIKAESSFYLAPGQIVVSGERQCGDGDVSNYSSSNPDVDFFSNDDNDFDYVLGYWVVESSAASKVPTKRSWQPIGYNTVPIHDSHQLNAESSLVQLVNKKEIGVNKIKAADAITGVLKFLKAQSDNAVDNGKTYTVYVAGMGCKQYQGTGNGLSENKLTSYELAHSFSVGIPSLLYTSVAITDEDSLKRSRYFKLENNEAEALNLAGDISQKGPIQVSFPSNFNAENKPTAAGTWAEIPSDHALVGYISDLLAIKHDELGADEASYLSAIQGTSVYTKLTNIKDKIEAKKCNELTEIDSEKMWWDKIPADRACFQLKKVIAELENFFKYHSTEASFTGARDSIIKILYDAAFMDYSQKYAQSDLFKESDYKDSLRCFEEGSKYVDHIVASVIVPLSEDTSSSPAVLKLNQANSMVHPEPMYALSNYSDYHANDLYPVFKMSSSDEASSGYNFKLGGGFANVGQDYGSVEGSVHLKMRIRSLGCNVNVFCQNDVKKNNLNSI